MVMPRYWTDTQHLIGDSMKNLTLVEAVEEKLKEIHSLLDSRIRNDANGQRKRLLIENWTTKISEVVRELETD